MPSNAKSLLLAITQLLRPRVVLELGPYDGRDSVLISEHCNTLICIEGRENNCVVTNHVLTSYPKRRAEFQVIHSDIRVYLDNTCLQELHLIWAAGVVYHFENPFDVIQKIARVCENYRCPVIGWTHLAERDEEVIEGLFGRWYIEDPINSAFSSIGNARSFWLTPESFCDAFHRSGFDNFAFLSDPLPSENGGLTACFVANT